MNHKKPAAVCLQQVTFLLGKSDSTVIVVNGVGGVQIRIGNHRSGMGRVDKLAVAYINAHMRNTGCVCILEEDNVAGLEFGLFYGSTLSVHGHKSTACGDSHGAQDIVDKSGTIKSIGSCSAPNIGNAQIFLGGVNNLLSNAG